MGTALSLALPSLAAGETLRCLTNEFDEGRPERRTELILSLDDAARTVDIGEEPTVIVRYTDDYVFGAGFVSGLVFHLDRTAGIYSATDVNRPRWSALGFCRAEPVPAPGG